MEKFPFFSWNDKKFGVLDIAAVEMGEELTDVETWTIVDIALMIIINVRDVYSKKPRLGDGIRIAGRVSSIRENIRVLPKSGNEGWFFREPTVQLFEDPKGLPKVIQPEMALNELDFHYEFCENSTQLLQTYFCGFKIEGTDQPWKVFAEDWSTSAIAALFGIREYSITSGYYSFFFNQTLANNVVLNDENSKKIDQQDGPIDFYTIPTRYINSYATGNAVYQMRNNSTRWFSVFHTKTFLVIKIIRINDFLLGI